MNLFSGLSAFGFRFRDQREQTAEGDGGGDAAGRAGYAAGKHADESAFRDRSGHALGERVAEPEGWYRLHGRYQGCQGVQGW